MWTLLSPRTISEIHMNEDQFFFSLLIPLNEICHVALSYLRIDITSPPSQIPSSGHLVHRYYQKVSCLRNCDLYRSLISDHEDPGRASGFHSHHHLEGNSSCSAIRTWSPYHGEGKVTL
ncbi:hypothetical protein M5K25_028300 [Dendrobium thyrsiflorum]|uniref:Uncharacterized protein n=1 Tax=Dendrobium thyrsiflorum TaxID=117978 RepID=A0ABD0TTK4_DENTH